MARTHLQDILLVLDVLHLLEPDDVVDGEDLEGEVLPAAPVPAQADPGEGACRGEWLGGPCKRQDRVGKLSRPTGQGGVFPFVGLASINLYKPGGILDSSTSVKGECGLAICASHIRQCAVCSVQCAVCSVQCAVCGVKFTEVCSLQCSAYCVWYAVCCVQ